MRFKQKRVSAAESVKAIILVLLNNINRLQ